MHTHAYALTVPFNAHTHTHTQRLHKCRLRTSVHTFTHTLIHAHTYSSPSLVLHASPPSRHACLTGSSTQQSEVTQTACHPSQQPHDPPHQHSTGSAAQHEPSSSTLQGSANACCSGDSRGRAGKPSASSFTGAGTGSGIGSGSGTGRGTDRGTDSGAGSGTSSGTGADTGSGTGSGIGSGTGRGTGTEDVGQATGATRSFFCSTNDLPFSDDEQPLPEMWHQQQQQQQGKDGRLPNGSPGRLLSALGNGYLSSSDGSSSAGEGEGEETDAPYICGAAAARPGVCARVLFPQKH